MEPLDNIEAGYEYNRVPVSRLVFMMCDLTLINTVNSRFYCPHGPPVCMWPDGPMKMIAIEIFPDDIHDAITKIKETRNEKTPSM